MSSETPIPMPEGLSPSKATLSEARSILVDAFAGDGAFLTRAGALEIALRALHRRWPANRVEAKLRALEGPDGSRGERPNSREFVHNLWRYARARAQEVPPEDVTVGSKTVTKPKITPANNVAHVKRLSGPGLR